MIFLLACVLTLAANARPPLIEVQEGTCESLSHQQDIVGLERVAAIVSQRVLMELIELENRFEETHDFLQRNARNDPDYKALIRFLRRKRLKIMRTAIQFDRYRAKHDRRAHQFEQRSDAPVSWVRRECERTVARMMRYDKKRATLVKLVDHANKLLTEAEHAPRP